MSHAGTFLEITEAAINERERQRLFDCVASAGGSSRLESDLAAAGVPDAKICHVLDNIDRARRAMQIRAILQAELGPDELLQYDTSVFSNGISTLAHDLAVAGLHASRVSRVLTAAQALPRLRLRRAPFHALLDEHMSPDEVRAYDERLVAQPQDRLVLEALIGVGVDAARLQEIVTALPPEPLADASSLASLPRSGTAPGARAVLASVLGPDELGVFEALLAANGGPQSLELDLMRAGVPGAQRERVLARMRVDAARATSVLESQLTVDELDRLLLVLGRGRTALVRDLQRAVVRPALVAEIFGMLMPSERGEGGRVA